MTKRLLSGYLTGLFLFLLSFTQYSRAGNLQLAIRKVQKGKYREAQKILNQLNSKSPDGLKKALILKNLGTTAHKLNQCKTCWLSYFNQALQSLKPSNKLHKRELSVILFQKANCLINSCFIKLREERLSGLSPQLVFELLSQYIQPAEKSLEAAELHYPFYHKADLLFLKADIEFLTRTLADQNNLEDTRKIITLYQNSYNYELKVSQTPRKDLLLTVLLRQAMLLRKAGRPNEALAVSKRSMQIISKNRELNLEARLQYAAGKMETFNTEAELTQLESLLTQAVDETETLRKANTSEQHYFSPKNYFAKRLSAYEMLLEFYSQQQDIKKMLRMIDQMKARAFKGKLAHSDSYQPLNLEAIQNRLAESNSIAVEYFLGAEHSWLFMVTKNQLRCRLLNCSSHQILNLADTTINGYTDLKLLRHYRSTQSQPDKYNRLLKAYQASHRLYDLLLKPLESLQAEPDTIYFIPHHVLNYLPFPALVKTLNSDNLLLSEFYAENSPAITFLPSLSLLNARHSKRFTGRSKIFYRTKFNNGFYDLPETAPETQKIAKLTGGIRYTERQFTKEKIIGKEPIDILYIASHVNSQYADPVKQSVILSADSRSELSVQELILNYPEQIQTNLTILSLCRTNIAEKTPLAGDDLSNLSRAFLLAGSRSVVTSQWAVTDDHTPEILYNLTQNYMQQLSPATALNLALKAYLQSAKSPFFRHPFYWGSLLILQKEP